MAERGSYAGSNFITAPCPVCGGMFSKCGLPNHIRRHKIVAAKPGANADNRRSAAWWDGWKDGYKAGLQDARK